MSEAKEVEERMIAHASGIIAAGRGKIKIRAAMRLVEFSDDQIKNMTLYQKVRRKAERMMVIDKSVPQLIGDGAETVNSTLSSAERTAGINQEASSNSAGSTTVDEPTASSNNPPTPRRLLENAGSPSNGKRSTDESLGVENSKKQHRRASHEVQREQANVIMKTKKESQAMKLATVLIQKNKELATDDPKRKSINEIVKEVNEECDSNISPKTAATYVRKGLIDTSPLKRGPTGKFKKPVYDALKGAYSTFLMLEQAECKKQSTIKDMAHRVNACVNHAGHTMTRDDLARKLRRDTSDLFNVGKANVVEQRRLQWTTHYNLDLWFTTWRNTLIGLGFGRETTPEDVDAVGEIVFFDRQLERIVNLDETDGTLDESNRHRGGRPPMVFTNPYVTGGGTSANKSGHSSTIICGSNAAGEALPPHFQLKSLAQQDSTQRISIDWFVHAHNVLGTFGHESERVLPTTFGLNTKGGMNTIELDKYIKKAILPLYPDVADVPGKRVLLKVDSGPGRMNVDMLATLRLQGIYLAPGVPNTTHVTQETDQNYGLYKSVYRANLRRLSEARQDRRKTLSVSDLPLLVFGGHDYITGVSLQSAFEKAFSKERNLACWRQCGAVPLTRLPLESNQVRHEMTVEGNAISREAKRLQEIGSSNRFHCEVLAGHGYFSGPLRKEAPKMRKAVPAITLPQTVARVRMIKKAKTSGQMFYATGGQHLNSDEFFQARALADREEAIVKMGKQKEKRVLLLKLHSQARELLAKKGPVTVENVKGRLYSKEDLKLLCKWKKAGLTKGDNGKNKDKKEDLAALYFSHPEPPNPTPWSEDEEAIMQGLKREDVPIEQTHLGVAARQMAVATANNMSKLDRNTRNQLLKSIADFDAAEQSASRVNAD